MINNTSKNPGLDPDHRRRLEAEIKLLRDLLDRVSAHAEGLEKELGGVSQEIDTLRVSSSRPSFIIKAASLI